jgi:hypothetical protein
MWAAWTMASVIGAAESPVHFIRFSVRGDFCAADLV